MCRCIDDEEFIPFGAFDRLRGRIKGFNLDGLQAVLLAGLVPLKHRLLLGIEVGDPDLETRMRGHGAEGSGQRALSSAALLRDEPNDD